MWHACPQHCKKGWAKGPGGQAPGDARQLGLGALGALGVGPGARSRGMLRACWGSVRTKMGT